MKSISRNLVIAVLVLSACALFLTAGCSDRRLNNSKSANLKIAINTYESFAKSTAIDVFVVLVTDPASGDTIAAGELLLHGAYLEGVIDNLPANVLLKFTVQAIDRQSVVIYSGSVVTAIKADQLNLIQVQMRPVVPMMKLTPRHYEFVNLTQNVEFFVEARVFNIDSLYGTAFRLTFEESYVWIDSAVVSPHLAEDSVIFHHNFVDTIDVSYAVSITQTDVTKQLVDANGDGTLARFYFTTTGGSVGAPAGSSTIGLQVTGMSKTNHDSIPLSSVYTENCRLDFLVEAL
ncbi:MAG: hypothetical protein DRP45_02285 [Candidatus Zixiibacteriota bacterium]|nr:MAG: hypothetical protein DRP45_02285 [candidate division Zixibacteria bacterium]